MQILDPPLTELGKKQSEALTGVTQLQDEVDVVVTSPLKRTLQSCRLSWAPAIERLGGLKKVICLPQAQECDDWQCDIGTDREELEADPEYAEFNFSLLEPEWTSKRGFWGSDAAATTNRAQWVRQWLRERPEHTIVLVAHGDIILKITAGAEGPSWPVWGNAEARVFEFDPATVESDECFLRQRGVVFAADVR
ncbi:hypothetical protein LTR37_013566 [Vermiconidia calcicola]|uniref:Uncharacterized protein n=1 Tax=Vermiconidia calcicola TaxID=1690605 RepID=A0ACC3MX85_9PEZI|nr:hypothetical protein LTR37_013566 [Vermiconidia calcicola]